MGDTCFGVFAVRVTIEGESLRGGRLMDLPRMEGHDAHAPTPFRSEELDDPLISFLSQRQGPSSA